MKESIISLLIAIPIVWLCSKFIVLIIEMNHNKKRY